MLVEGLEQVVGANKTLNGLLAHINTLVQFVLLKFLPHKLLLSDLALFVNLCLFRERSDNASAEFGSVGIQCFY